MYVRICVTSIMVDRCNQRPADYQPFSHSCFLQVALSFYPETSSLSYTFSTTFMRPLRELCLPPLSFSLRALLHPFWFLASALTFISFCASSTLSRQLSSHPRRRHQQTSWLYRESRLDYESWLEAGRLAHRSRREVPFFPFSAAFLLTSPSELYSLSRSRVALPFRPPLSPSLS